MKFLRNFITWGKENRRFWVLFSAIAGCSVCFLLATAAYRFLFPTWHNLPPFPNGETGREFTEVLFRDSIDVVTDQGHYYRCRFLVPDNCWIKIPKEDYQGLLLEIEEVTDDQLANHLPEIPRNARTAIIAFHSHEDFYEVFLVIIRENGQVALWERDISKYGPREIFLWLWWDFKYTMKRFLHP